MTTIQKKSLKVGKLVSTDHVNTVIRNYKQERWVHNSKRLGKEDSLSVWYSIEELEEFHCQEQKIMGQMALELYFGAYDKDYQEQPLYAGRQTLCSLRQNKRKREGESNKDIYIQTEKGTTILAWNAGHICPPFCGTKEILGWYWNYYS